VQERVVREIRTLRVMWRGLETELWRHFGATALVPDPTKITDSTRRYGRGRWGDCQSGKGATAWTWIPPYLNATDDKRER